MAQSEATINLATTNIPVAMITDINVDRVPIVTSGRIFNTWFGLFKGSTDIFWQ